MLFKNGHAECLITQGETSADQRKLLNLLYHFSRRKDDIRPGRFAFEMLIVTIVFAAGNGKFMDGLL